jgi:RNA polymerase sporulation-specific sigma factor
MQKTENDLCKENIGLVQKIARSFYPSKSDLDDYVQVGMIGLLKAVRSHDPNKGKLSTFAHKCITNELIRYTGKNRIVTEELINNEQEYSCDFVNLLAVFDCVTEDEKKILLLKFESGYTFQAIADLLKIPYHKVKNQYKKAIKKIKRP